MSIYNLYKFIASEFPEEVSHQFSERLNENPTGQCEYIMGNGFKHLDRICEKVVKMWEEAFGYELGNLVTQFLPYGGVYLTGNIISEY